MFCARYIYAGIDPLCISSARWLIAVTKSYQIFSPIYYAGDFLHDLGISTIGLSKKKKNVVFFSELLQVGQLFADILPLGDEPMEVLKTRPPLRNLVCQCPHIFFHRRLNDLGGMEQHLIG